MARLVEFGLEDGGVVVFEVADEHIRQELLVGSSAHEVVHRASDSLEAALNGLAPTFSVVKRTMSALTPDQFEIELGLTATAEAGVVVSKFGGEANIKVKATWKSGDRSD